MIKLIYLATRKEGMSVQDFQRHWRETHAPIAAKIPGVRRYIQNHTLDDPLNEPLRASRSAPAPYTGLTEAWFDRYDLEKILASPESEGALGFGYFLEDERRFIDFNRSSVWSVKERVFIDQYN